MRIVVASSWFGLVAVASLFTVRAVIAQNSPLVKKVDAADLRASSLYTLELVGKDVRELDGNDRAASRIAIEQRILALPNALQPRDATFAAAINNDFSASVRRAQEQNEKSTLLLRFRNQGIMYGTDVVSKGVELLPGLWGKLGGTVVAPLMQRGVETYLNLQVDEVSKANEAALANIVRKQAALFVAKGNALPSDQQLPLVFDAMLDNALGTSAADRSIMHTEALRFTAQYLRNHDQEIQFLANQLNGQTQQIAQLELSTKAELIKLRKDVEASIESRLGQLADGLTLLSERQLEAAAGLEKVQHRVSANETRIRSLEVQAKSTQADISALHGITNEHSKLLAKNRVQIDMLSAYAFNGLSLNQKLRALDDGSFDNIFSSKEKQDLRADLKVASTIETINDAISAGSQLADALIETGLLKGETAKTVGVAVQVIGNVAGIGSAIFSGNPTGAISGIVNLVRLGIGSKPQPSPEMRMLEHVSGKLDKLQQNTVIIDAKLSYLIEFTQKAYEQQAIDLANQTALIERHFERINWKLDYQTRVGTALLRGDLSKCSGRRSNGPMPASFGDYRDRYDADADAYLDDCLKGLQTLTSVSSAFAAVYYEKYGGALDPNAADQLEYEIRTVYEPAVELFCRYFGLDGSATERALAKKQALAQCVNPSSRPRVPELALAINELGIPGRSSLARRVVRDSLRKFALGEQLDPRLVLGAALSPVAVDSVSASLVDLMPYFEISAPGAGRRPVADALEFLSIGEAVRRGRRNNLRGMLERTTAFANYALAQQVLISGAPLVDRMYQSFYAADATSRERELAVELLETNPYVAHNFAVRVLQEAFGVSPDGTPTMCAQSVAEPCFRRYQLANATITAENVSPAEISAALGELNSATAPLQLSFSVVGQSLMVSHPYWHAGGKAPLVLQAASPDLLIRNELLYPETVYQLLTVRDRLTEALIAVSLPEQIAKNQQSISLDHYRWLLFR